ncbi:MAG: AAA family ATPase, partial [Pseudomonadota bacterium]
MSETLPVPSTGNTPENIYAAPAEWVAQGAGAQGNLFLTGRAGTGKTTLLRKFMAHAGDSAIVL